VNRCSKSVVLVALLAGFLGGLAAQLLPLAHAQEKGPARTGRYQISTIPGAVYLLDTEKGDVYVRNYTTKRWEPAGNPLSAD
jgi:hypothetical protein